MTNDFGNREHAKRTAKLLSDSKSKPTDIFGSFWSWINGVAGGIAHDFGSAVTAGFRAMEAGFSSMVTALKKGLAAMERGLALMYNWVLRFVKIPTDRQLAALWKSLRRDQIRDIRLIAVVANALTGLAYRLFNLERKRRQRAERQQWAQTLLHIKHSHQEIEREAVAGYRTTYSDRVSLIQKVLDLAVLRNPAVKHLVGDVVKGLLDFAEVEDPIARWVLGFAVREIIDKLGIDKAIGTLVDDLLAPLIGEPKPKNLSQVVADITQRLGKIESWQATFMDDGGAEVEQAGETWKAVTSLTADAAILAFAGYAAADPSGWSKDINGTIGRAANDLVSGMARLIKDA